MTMTAAIPAIMAMTWETLYKVPDVPVSGFSTALALSLLHVSESGANVQASLMILLALASFVRARNPNPRHPINTMLISAAGRRKYLLITLRPLLQR